MQKSFYKKVIPLFSSMQNNIICTLMITPDVLTVKAHTTWDSIQLFSCMENGERVNRSGIPAGGSTLLSISIITLF